ncbi:MAG: hypothetical protein V4719_21635 [Planctomycetota bacterium]
MDQLEELQQRLTKTSSLTKLTPRQIERLQGDFPGLPDEYVRFLSLIGYGNLEELQLYSGLVSPGSIYPKPQSDLSGIMLFGDDFQGYCFGFDIHRQFSLIEVDPRGNLQPSMQSGFLSFIASYVSD